VQRLHESAHSQGLRDQPVDAVVDTLFVVEQEIPPQPGAASHGEPDPEVDQQRRRHRAVLLRTKEQEAVAQGIATPEQKAAAKKQRRFIVTRRPYYPSMAEITEAFKWLADRGFGQAPKTVQIEGSVTTGFKMVFRRWAPGTDPASLPMAEMPKQIVTS